MTTTDTLFITDLNPFYGLIAVSGPDAPTFLQGQLTADVRAITPTQPGFSAFCNPKGRIRALFRIFLDQNTYFLQTPIGVLPSALAALQKVARFSKVVLKDVSLEWQRIGIWLTDNHLEKLHLFDHKEIPILTLPCVEPYKRFELIGQPNNIKPLWDKLAALENTKITDFDAWKMLDAQAGIPEIWPDTIEKFLPHNLNLPALGAVSFNKGCYCGQEIIARMEYRSKKF